VPKPLPTAEILSRIDKLNVWSRGGERAPHKPLLILMALGRLTAGERSLAFEACEGQLTELLREFGPTRQSQHPEYPFWRLQNDGLWDVTASGPLASRESNTDPKKTELRAKHAVGRFPDGVRLALKARPALVAEIAHRLLDAHFAESTHGDILEAVGLSLDLASATVPPRDPTFRARVLTAYQYRCAVCGLDIRINNMTVGLDAAHIQWHQAGGPGIESNGLALCSLHHKMFDLGAFTVDLGHRVLVSELVHGAGQLEEVLLRHHGNPIGRPVQPEHLPAAERLTWHQRQVFKERARPLA
jgi:putative restriction endonuclease